MQYQMSRVVDAIQFTGLESVPAIQAFMAPSSPQFNASNGKYVRLIIDVPNPEEDARWPGQGPHYKLAFLQIGDWVIKDPSGAFAMMTDKEFNRDCTPVAEAIPPSAPMAIPYADTPAPGDDPDPTMPIDVTHVQPAVDDEIPL